MAERLEDELRALGRDWERKPDDATVAAIAEAATTTGTRRKRFGDIGVPAAAAALLTAVSVAGVVVPWVVARNALPATATSAPPLPTRTGDSWRSVFCGEWGPEPLLASADAIADLTGWRPPAAETTWGSPLELRITTAGAPAPARAAGYGITVATYRVNGRPVTLERYPPASTFPPPERGSTEEVPVRGTTGLLVQAPSRTGYGVEHVPGRVAQQGRLDCSAPRLMWTTAEGVGYAITGQLSRDELVALAEQL